MRCRRSLVALAAIATLLAGCAREDPRPNIVLVSLDTVRRDAVRAYEPAAAPLPALDSLAARSARFQALSPAAWTLPAHASLLSGVYPHRHGAVHRSATLSRAVPSLPALLAARGYDTVAFTDGGFLDGSYGFGRGFRRYDDRISRGEPAAWWLPGDGRPQPDGSSDLFARAIAFLHHRASSRPLFLFAHSYAVHDYFKTARAGEAVRSLPDGTRIDGAYLLACLVGEHRCTPSDWGELAARYRAALRDLDTSVGRLLATTRETLAERPTWIVVVSDHGEGLDPRGGATHHGGALAPDVLAVPLLIAGPGVRPTSVATPVSLVDVAPTLASLAGAGGADFDGASLAPLLEGGASGWLQAFRLGHRTLEAEEHSYWWRDGRRFAAPELPSRPLAVGVLAGGWWYVQTTTGEAIAAFGPPASSPPPLPALRRSASPWLALRPVPTQRHEESDELAATLASLGYAGGAP